MSGPTWTEISSMLVEVKTRHGLDVAQNILMSADGVKRKMVDVPVEEFPEIMRKCAAFLSEPPLSMILHCPVCHRQHIDAPEPKLGWTNPPHKSHQCVFCREEGRVVIWRPADVATRGVATLGTKSRGDTIWWGEDGKMRRALSACDRREDKDGGAS